MTLTQKPATGDPLAAEASNTERSHRWTSRQPTEDPRWLAGLARFTARHSLASSDNMLWRTKTVGQRVNHLARSLSSDADFFYQQAIDLRRAADVQRVEGRLDAAFVFLDQATTAAGEAALCYERAVTELDDYQQRRAKMYAAIETWRARIEDARGEAMAAATLCHHLERDGARISAAASLKYEAASAALQKGDQSSALCLDPNEQVPDDATAIIHGQIACASYQIASARFQEGDQRQRETLH